MIHIRLSRGPTSSPGYRIVVSHKARGGDYIEDVGHYNPRNYIPTEVKEDRALHWLSEGAQPSGIVRKIFEDTGTWGRFQRLLNGEALEDLLTESHNKRLILSDQKTLPLSPDKHPTEIPSEPQDDFYLAPVPEPTVEPELELEYGTEPIPDPAPKAEPVPVPVADESPQPDESEPAKANISVNVEEPAADPLPPADDSSIPEPAPDPMPVVEDIPQPDESETKEPTDKTPENKDVLYEDMNRPGATELSEEAYPPDPVPDPSFRANRTREDIREARRNEPDVENRRREVLQQKWNDKDTATRDFLRVEYKGECQICGDTFPQHDGGPYFEALYVESYKTAEWLDRPANTLCLCPNHVARFLHGARVFTPDYREQVLSYPGSGEHEINLELCGEQVRIRFSERHIIGLKVIVEETAGDAAS
ncbi:MAG: 30S ribosomal protein S16 [Chloroflexi bacterium]|nr:30S ribosomal protein S16 [Chloroflexota bacterium]